MMKQLLFKFCLLFTLGFSFCNSAQELVAEKGSFGVDTKNKIIVWHVTDLDALKISNRNLTKIRFNNNFNLNETTVDNLSYEKGSLVSNGENYTLYISKLPLIHLSINTSKISGSFKIPGYFTFFNDKKFIKSTMGVRHRGNLSMSFAKKSFDLEFWKDSISEETKDIKFKDLRSDDDWILDAMFNEPLRLRSFIATNLWSKIHQPYYLKDEPKAKSGFGVEFVEVFQNNEYYGIYQLSESVDRKQLKLKKKKKNVIYGEFFKANSYEGGPGFTKAPEKYDNLSLYWNGWLNKYSYIDYESNFKQLSEWKNLSELTNLVINSSDESFSKTIQSKVKISNMIDYYLFVNLLGATDNLGKNYYLAKYTKNEPYFFVPWDLDGVWGVIQDGKTVWDTSGVFDNGLLKRLIEVNPNNYKEKVKNRWTELRQKEFSNETLFSEFNKIYTNFTVNKIYEREQLVWINMLNETSNEEHYKNLKVWLEKRLILLDNHFKDL